MEAVILAAGRGQRMEGFSKPFYKPLLEINGIPLIRYAVEYASAAGATKTTIVVSPHNSDAVSEVLTQYSSWISVVTQEEPLGPGHATLIGIEDATGDKTMLLMSDNIMSIDAVQKMATECQVKNTSGIGIRMVLREQAKRFTRIRHSTNGGYLFVEGIEVTDDDLLPGRNEAMVWCGPVIFDSERGYNTLRKAFKLRKSETGELKIGPYLSEILSVPIVFSDVQAMDVGVPAAYLEKTKDSSNA